LLILAGWVLFGARPVILIVTVSDWSFAFHSNWAVPLGVCLKVMLKFDGKVAAGWMGVIALADGGLPIVL
jgi:hypothetical protein